MSFKLHSIEVIDAVRSVVKARGLTIRLMSSARRCIAASALACRCVDQPVSGNFLPSVKKEQGRSKLLCSPAARCGEGQSRHSLVQSETRANSSVLPRRVKSPTWPPRAERGGLQKPMSDNPTPSANIIISNT
jgi:hypothetical protein